MSRILLDLRGLSLHSYYGGEPQDTVIAELPDKEGNARRVPAASHGVYEFIRQYLVPILQHNAPIDIIGVLEGSNANARRRGMLPTYKAKDEQDASDKVIKEEKDKCFIAIQKLLLGIGSILVKTPYTEADDTLAYLCERLEGGKIIYTVDNDMLQLHSDDVAVMVRNEYKEEYKASGMKVGLQFSEECPAILTRLYKSICGDSSDGYIGVRGMGDTAWNNLVEKHGYESMVALDECAMTGILSPIKEALEAEHCKILEKLYANREEWIAAHKLARLHPEWCELSYAGKVVRPQWAKRLPSRERVSKVLEPLGLQSLSTYFERFMPETWLVDKNVWKETDKDLMFKEMSDSPFCAFDWESYDSVTHQPYQEAKRSGTYVDVLNQVITGGSFCYGPNMNKTFYMSVNHRDTANCTLADTKEILTETKNKGVKMVAHNAQFEICLAKQNLDFDFDIENLPFDTSIMAAYADENEDKGLKMLCRRILNYTQSTYKEVVGEGTMLDVSGEEVLGYGADDSFVTAHLAVLFNTIMECEQTWEFYSENEPFFDIALLPAYRKGIPIDYIRMAGLKKEDDSQAEAAEKSLRQSLLENCSEISLDGFITLWEEVRLYETALKSSKGKTEEEIEFFLTDKKKEIKQACKFTPLQPPKIEVDRLTISLIAKTLLLPSIRSIGQDWLERYCKGLANQDKTFRENGEDGFTEEQKTFVDLLYCAAPYVKLCEGSIEDVKEIADFKEFAISIVSNDKSTWVGDELNVGSPLQMAQLFYGKMNLPIQLRNYLKNDEGIRSQFDLEGAPSTNENAIRTWMAELEETDWKYAVLENVLLLKAVKQRNSLYYRPYPLWSSPVDSRIHPGIRNCGTITKRPSSSNPNIFQVSKVKDKGRMRGCFLPQSVDQPDAEKEIIISIDFDQQELVILAGESNDANLRSCYVGSNKKDVHSLTGTKILNNLRKKSGLKPIFYEEFATLNKAEDEEVTTIRKRYAKVTNFLMVYGGSAAGLSRKVIVPKSLAEEFVASFFTTYPNVAKFQDRKIEFAKKHGFVKTCFGTRKHCKDILNKNGGLRSAAERQAVNMTIQGAAADVLKVVLRKIVTTKLMEETRATIMAPVYDEVVSSVPISKAIEYINRMSDIMEMELPGLNISLSSSVSLGLTWGDQKELGKRPLLEVMEEELSRLDKEYDEYFKLAT